LKGVVVKTSEQQQVFKWLSDKNLNGWNDHAPDWNFGKYIIDENGVLTHYFGPSISPLDKEFLNAVK
jgi:glutathione peroxidase